MSATAARRLPKSSFVCRWRIRCADAYIVIPDGKLDLAQLTWEDLLLFLPSKLLCRDDCKGICPQCGKNLNEGTCECKKEIDPRFAALLDLLDS